MVNLINKELLHGIVPKQGTADGDQNAGNHIDLFRTVWVRQSGIVLAPEMSQQTSAADIEEQAGAPHQQITYADTGLVALMNLKYPFIVYGTVAESTRKATQ